MDFSGHVSPLFPFVEISPGLYFFSWKTFLWILIDIYRWDVSSAWAQGQNHMDVSRPGGHAGGVHVPFVMLLRFRSLLRVVAQDCLYVWLLGKGDGHDTQWLHGRRSRCFRAEILESLEISGVDVYVVQTTEPLG